MSILKQIYKLSKELPAQQKAKAIAVIGIDMLSEFESTEMQFEVERSGLNLKCNLEASVVEGEVVHD